MHTCFISEKCSHKPNEWLKKCETTLSHKLHKQPLLLMEIETSVRSLQFFYSLYFDEWLKWGKVTAIILLGFVIYNQQTNWIKRWLETFFIFQNPEETYTSRNRGTSLSFPSLLRQHQTLGQQQHSSKWDKSFSTKM